MRKIVFNADGVGSLSAINKAVTECYTAGILKSISIDATGAFFDDVFNTVLPKCEGIGVGVHLNLTSGNYLCSDIDYEKFNSFFKLIKLSFNKNNKACLEDIEREFRRQIEKVLAKTKLSHIDSFGHIHSVPSIFEIVCRLAKEYGIKQVRTHFEKFYIMPEINIHFNKIYYQNILKKILLNSFSLINENTVHKYELETNDYIIGTGYESLMNSLAVVYGLRPLSGRNITIEVPLRPCRYEEGTIDKFFDEYMILCNKKLKSKLERSDFEITNYVKKED